MNAPSPSKAPCLGCMSDDQPVANGVASVNAFMTCVAMLAVSPINVGLYMIAFCPRHQEVAARAIASFAMLNHIEVAELTAKLSAVLGLPK